MAKPNLLTMTDERQQAFHGRVLQSNPDECWHWQGRTQNEGYGYFDALSRGWVAHRLMLELKIGRALGRDECACHSCDNPPCVNPAHLWVGSNAENIADSMRKGRARGPKNPRRAEEHGGTRLTNEIVAQIWLAKATLTLPEASAHFAVPQSTIRAIWDRVNWRGVTDKIPAPAIAKLHGEWNAGESNAHAKLTAEQVREIWARRGTVRNRQMAHEYGVSEATVSMILSGKTWRRVTGAGT